MPEPFVEPSIVDWYTQVEDESTRLSRSPHTRVELLRTREIIGRFTAEAGREPLDVVDIGGGTGVHAGWLAEQGHRVTLVDPVLRHVEAAAQLPGVAAQLGDGRALAFADDTFDLGLALGPLYHLADRAGRVGALRELAHHPPLVGGFDADEVVTPALGDEGSESHPFRIGLPPGPHP